MPRNHCLCPYTATKFPLQPCRTSRASCRAIIREKEGFVSLLLLQMYTHADYGYRGGIGGEDVKGRKLGGEGCDRKKRFEW